MKIRQLTADAMLAAMCAVLGGIALDFTVVKISFESFPILLAALLFGPLDGGLVAFVGTMIYQILRYSFMPTTILWVIPYVAAGVLLGSYAKKYRFRNTDRQIIFSIICAELLILLLNTAAIYIDSKISGYYFPGLVTGNLLLRLLLCVGKSAVFGIIMPKILYAIAFARRKQK